VNVNGNIVAPPDTTLASVRTGITLPFHSPSIQLRECRKELCFMASGATGRSIGLSHRGTDPRSAAMDSVTATEAAAEAKAKEDGASSLAAEISAAAVAATEALAGSSVRINSLNMPGDLQHSRSLPAALATAHSRIQAPMQTHTNGSNKRSLSDMQSEPVSGPEFGSIVSPFHPIARASMASAQSSSALRVSEDPLAFYHPTGPLARNLDELPSDHYTFIAPGTAIQSDLTLGSSHVQQRRQHPWHTFDDNSIVPVDLFETSPRGSAIHVPVGLVSHRSVPAARRVFDSPAVGGSVAAAASGAPGADLKSSEQQMKRPKLKKSGSIPVFDIPCYDEDKACGKLVSDFEASFSGDEVDLSLLDRQGQTQFEDMQSDDSGVNFLTSVNPVSPPNTYL
jgi:hypothetical protein